MFLKFHFKKVELEKKNIFTILTRNQKISFCEYLMKGVFEFQIKIWNIDGQTNGQTF